MEKPSASQTPICTDWDRLLAVPMFAVTVAFLLGLAVLLHQTRGDQTDGDLISPLSLTLIAGLGVLYLAYVAEFVIHWRAGGQGLKRHFIYLLIPVARLCTRDHLDGSHAWIPGLGWKKADSKLEKFLARKFSGPMIIIALCVLPVVGAEFLYDKQIDSKSALRFFIDSCGAAIWAAFVFEFVVMVSIVEKRLRYCKQNWIDLAVVLLPIVSYLGAARLGRLLKLKQLTRTARIYRMRGLAIRSWRAIVVLDVIDSLLRRDPQQRVEKLESQIHEKRQEIEHLHSEIVRIKLKFEAKAKKDASNDRPA